MGFANDTDPRYLFEWCGRGITSYTAGSNAQGGHFDISNIELLSTEDGAADLHLAAARAAGRQLLAAAT